MNESGAIRERGGNWSDENGGGKVEEEEIGGGRRK